MARETLPQILLDDRTRWFLELRRRFHSRTGRELGFAHATRMLARVIPKWQELPLQGPGGYPVHLDLRNKEGYFSSGYGNTIGHMTPLLKLVWDGDVVLDVGGNIGLWSRELLAHKRLSKLVAFEPERRAFQLLQRNLAPYPCASCERVALGARDGTARLSENLVSGQNHVLTDDQPVHRSQEVPMCSLDSWAASRGIERIDVLKVDVEGLELDVFQGGVRLLEQSTPLVYFEYVPERGREGQGKAAAFEFLRAMGYEMQAVLLDGRSVRVASAADCDQLTTFSHDMIAVHPRGAGRTQQLAAG